jgi:hypothetical protein
MRHTARILARTSNDLAMVYVALDRAGIDLTKAGDHLYAMPHNDPGLVKTIRSVGDVLKKNGFTWKSSGHGGDLQYVGPKSTVTLAPRAGRLLIQVH